MTCQKETFYSRAAIMVVILMGSCVAQSATRPAASSPTYYLAADIGNNKNDGLSKSTPWKTVSRLNSAKMPPGTHVFFKRGLLWREQLSVSSSGTADKPIVLGAYGKGRSPIISGADVVSGWSLHSPNIYKKTFPKADWPYLSNLSEDGGILTLIYWSRISAANETNIPRGSFSFDKDSNTLYVRTTDDKPPASHVMAAGRRLYCVLVEEQSDVVIRELTLEQASLHGVFVSNSSRIMVNECTIRYCGGMWLLNRFFAGNGIEWSRNSANCSITSSHIYQIFDSGASPQLYDSNVELRSIVIDGNTIEHCGMDGIEISIQHHLKNAFIRGVTVRNNTIRNGGHGWSGKRTGNGIKIYNQPRSFHHIKDVKLIGNKTYKNRGLPILLENAANVDTPEVRGNTDNLGNDVFLSK